MILHNHSHDFASEKQMQQQLHMAHNLFLLTSKGPPTGQTRTGDKHA
jgi:hypothetical protein